ncbi:hypothetical protein EC973_004622 [Apophysomyces ossiformis]|uniref:Uncharacterized protein n=1 Tax=Apophysomyces ossiformis TaxID=679940 RepID=A0A8H7ET75_9FUNG|nr:hypothetical protein EC973_004622 [Apophysomyces ossiformis]
MASAEETKAMIEEVESLLAISPGDESLSNMLKELLDIYAQQQVTTLFPPGSRCAIPFPLDADEFVLLPAVVLQYTLNDAVVLILCPIDRETIPCTALSTCSGCERSHGYVVSASALQPYEKLDMTNAENYEKHKRVWCKREEEWHMARIIRIEPDESRRYIRWMDSAGTCSISIDEIIPVKYLDEDHDPSHGASDDSYSEDDHIDQRITVSARFGLRDVLGFIDLLIKGQGLGREGQGRVEPVEARPYRKGGARDHSLDHRPGLGSISINKAQQAKKPEPKEDTVFGFMNALLDASPAQTTNRSVITKKESKAGSVEIDPREAQRKLAMLQRDISAAESTLSRALESVRRNKGTPMESQFRSKAKSAADTLDALKRQAATLQGNLKRSKDREKMTSF